MEGKKAACAEPVMLVTLVFKRFVLNNIQRKSISFSLRNSKSICLFFSVSERVRTLREKHAWEGNFNKVPLYFLLETLSYNQKPPALICQHNRKLPSSHVWRVGQKLRLCEYNLVSNLLLWFTLVTSRHNCFFLF